MVARAKDHGRRAAVFAPNYLFATPGLVFAFGSVRRTHRTHGLLPPPHPLPDDDDDDDDDDDSNNNNK